MQHVNEFEEDTKRRLSDLEAKIDELRKEYWGRQAVNKFLYGAIIALGATVGWLVDNAYTMAKHIDFNITGK